MNGNVRKPARAALTASAKAALTASAKATLTAPARIALITAVLVIMALAAAFVTGKVAPSYAASNFIIRDYDIDMKVNEDDTYDIHETLEVEFTADSHGIYRTIPYRTTLDRDGQMSTYYAKIRNFRMLSDQPYKLEKRSDKAFYRIGDANRFADTNTTYEFTYTYDTRGDHLKDGDEVYHNLIGTDWEAKSIDHVSFRITFPKDIDMSKVGMKTGYQENVKFETERNLVVKGETDQNCIRGLTIRAVLPEGYFTRQAKSSNIIFYILIAVLVLAAVFGFVLWRKFGVDPPIVEPVEFYPPDDLSAPEVGYLKDGEIKGKHVIAILLTLADKGYLKIREVHSKSAVFKRDITEYEIERIRKYDGDVIGEASFMGGLFRTGEVVRISSLRNTFYKTVEKIKTAVVKRYEGKLYDKKADSCAEIMNVLGIIGMVLLVISSKIANQTPFIMDGEFIYSIVTLIIEIALPVTGFYFIAQKLIAVKKRFTDTLTILFMALLIATGFGLAVLFDTVMGYQIMLYLIGMGAIFILFILAALCKRKSDYYCGILGKIRGYERFLKSAEKDRMEALAEEDPDYFYKNLAFAFALGVTGVFAERFASLAVKPPEWYETTGIYNANTFSSSSMMGSLDRMLSNASSSMTSSPSSSGSGGGSFSGGGGGGGGGGGSW